ncbi:sugar phosphate isomerase/epimerase family protein [Polycladomyces subterraneus]|uniref:Sugar phosphate isomerase/epimerase n=1 Tax=Polycladomyces subterraneus TaxID=1016997 RepID=A0ABT8IRD5_9BACL|nr:sugar phosphate isomerase/epimerase [Polycladomyces subterraneus]MDN4595371.1 sugar phosphate isomerase/epimerase [Polycladomyces subterraneus]
MPQIGLQLYTLRREMEQDMATVLHTIARMGYRGVEFAGFHGKSAEEIRRLLQETGLHPIASHVGLQELKTALPDVIAFHRTIGCDTLICPWVEPGRITQLEGAQALARDLINIARVCCEHGLRFGYHHHDFELEHRVQNQPALDWLLEQTAEADVKVELDVYWLKKAGMSEAEYIHRYAGRVLMIHLKDMEDSPDHFFAAVGSGLLDVGAVITAGTEAGTEWFIVEQDACREGVSPIEEVKRSAAYLKAGGWLV